MQVNDVKLKLFVLADTDEDYTEVVENYDIWMNDVERLVDPTQLRGHDYIEVWDCRKMSRLLQEQNIETFVMPNKED